MCPIAPGTAYGSLENPKISFGEGVNMRAGTNKISLLSIAVGLPVCALFRRPISKLTHAHWAGHNYVYLDGALHIAN